MQSQHQSSINTFVDLGKNLRKDLSYNNILKNLKSKEEQHQGRSASYRAHLITMQTEYIDDQQISISSESQFKADFNGNKKVAGQKTLRQSILQRLKNKNKTKTLIYYKSKQNIKQNNFLMNSKEATFRPNIKKILYGINHQAQPLIHINQKNPKKNKLTLINKRNKSQLIYYQNPKKMANQNFYLRQQMLLKTKKIKTQALKTQIQQKQIKECTFKPKLTKYKRIFV